MTHGTAETTKVDEHWGLRGSGIASAILATLGMVIILVLNTVEAARIPTGWAALAATGMIISPVLILGGMILHKVEAILDHVTALRGMVAIRDVAQGTELIDVDEEHKTRRAYAHGAVDMMDGRAAVIPIGQMNGFRVTPARDQPR